MNHLSTPPMTGHRQRRGTVLLLCIAVMVTITVLAAGFVKMMQLHRVAGQDDGRTLLAREAAIQGRNLAIEQIVRGYIQEPVTRQDGPGIAPFQSYVRSYAVDDINVPSSQIDLNDRASVNPSFTDVMCFSEGGDFKVWAFSNGWTETDGRGRYIEPEFYNLAHALLNPDNSFAVSQPVVPVPFGTVATANPDRCAPLLLDDRLQRLTVDPLSGRSTAHYRLRYAVNVIDLDGEMLLNPDPDIQGDRITDPDPANLPGDPLTLPPGQATSTPDNPDVVSQAYPRIVRAGHALSNIRFVWSGYGNMEPNETGQGSLGRAEHVFMGRGYCDNFDQRLPFNRTPVPGDYKPVTFPLMYRGQGCADIFKTTNTNDFAPIASALLTAQDVNGLPAGGEPMPVWCFPLNLTHCLVGAQYSFHNHDMAVYSQSEEGVYDYGTMAWGSFTPFGRALANRKASIYKQNPNASLDRGYQRYYGDVDVPWCVNPLTAAPMEISGMVIGYMPPGVIQRQYYYNQDSRHIGGIYYSDVVGVRDLFIPQISAAFARYLPPTRTVASGTVLAPDYHVACDQLSENGPHGAAAGTEQWAGYRQPADRYPGPVAFSGFTASTTSPALVHDNLGHYLRLKSHWVDPDNGATYALKLPPMRDPCTSNQFWLERQWSGRFPEIPYNPTGVGGGQGTNWQLGDMVTVRVDPESFWATMGQALCSAIAVARGQWLQFANAKANPHALFSQAPDVRPAWGPWPGATRVTSMAGLDALFLANLGIDIFNPSSQAAIPVWGSPEQIFPATVPNEAPLGWGSPGSSTGQVLAYSYTPDYTIASLANAPFFYGNPATLPNPDPTNPAPIANPAYDPSQPTYTPAQRAAVMALMLNDFRLSFLGSSPGYQGNFLPLDFLGDGKVRCSGYPPNPQATAIEQQLHLDQYVTGGAVTVTTPFSTTGCFYLGKSKFYRVLSRGEVWDNFLKAPASQNLLDSVICVDPADEANELAPASSQHPNRQYSTHIIYQRSWSDPYNGDLARNY